LYNDQPTNGLTKKVAAKKRFSLLTRKKYTQNVNKIFYTCLFPVPESGLGQHRHKQHRHKERVVLARSLHGARPSVSKTAQF
jgi:hypothetical protein